jgi:two-component system, cell cycle response regulator
MKELPEQDVEDLVRTALEHGDRLRLAVEDILRYVDSPTLAKDGQPLALAQLPELVEHVRTMLGIAPVRWQGLERVKDATAVLSSRPMELILYELLENAKKFHPTHEPTIDIILERRNANEVRLVVQDNGRVLTAEQLAKVWSPYYQVEKNFTGEVVGMGLGLSTVASLVWSVGGRCHIFNREDEQGVAVELILPLMQNMSRAEVIM